MLVKEFREKYANEKLDNDKYRDLNFAGCVVKKDNLIKKGFFHLYHGDKENISNFIETQVKIAEDDQAIYEFLQNAIDPDSTQFYIFYDKNNFLVINNGKKFTFKDITSLLNFSQSQKNEDESKIGKFGVGFKLIHRLVGETNGISEIMEGKGPILLSWNNGYLKNILNKDLREIEKHWLFKIIYTNFPCGLNEKIRDENYKVFSPFKNEEFDEMIEFIKKQNLNLDLLQEGSIFYLKLGKDKFDVLNSEEEILKRGVGVSLTILNSIRKIKGIERVVINQNIIEKEDLEIITNDEYVFLYPNLNNIVEFYNKPEKINFYKFFPMGDEINNLNFIIHHYNFGVETNRRKLQENENKELLRKIANDILKQLDNFKDSSFKNFVTILGNLYLSDLNHKIYIYQNLTRYFEDYITENIPTKSGKVLNNKDNIIVLNSKLKNVPLQNFEYFYFDDKTIIKEAKKKLNIKTFSIIDLILKDNIIDWILELDDKQFEIVLEEIEKHKKNFSQSIVEKFNKRYSLSEIKNILKIFKVLDTVNFAVIKKPTNIKIKNRNIKEYLIDSTQTNIYIKNLQLKEIIEKYKISNILLIPDELENEILEIRGKSSDDKEILKTLFKKNNKNLQLEIIDFFTTDEEKLYIINSLKKLSLDIEKENKLQIKILKFIQEMSSQVDMNLVKEKIKFFENANLIDVSLISPYISFEYGKVKNLRINSNLDGKIIEFIEELGFSFLQIKEENKEQYYQYLKNNRFLSLVEEWKFLIFYSLERKMNYLENFNRFYLNDKDYHIFRNLFKNIDFSIDEIANSKLFKVKDFFPFLNNTYIEDNYAIEEEKLTIQDKEVVKILKKFGLKEDKKVSKIRKDIVEKKEVSSDRFLKLSQIQLVNTLKFLANNNFKFSLNKKDISYKNIERLFKKLDIDYKKKNDVFPCLDNLSNLIIKNNIYFDLYITNENLKSNNSKFKERLKETIKNENIIYFDILDLGEPLYNWEEMKENFDEKMYIEEQKLENNLDFSERNFDDLDFESKWQIGRKGEVFIYKILVEKYGEDNVNWLNKNATFSKEDKGSVDIIVKQGVKSLNFEVKTTINGFNDETFQFFISPTQFKHLQKENYLENNYLVLVVDILNKPEYVILKKGF